MACFEPAGLCARFAKLLKNLLQFTTHALGKANFIQFLCSGCGVSGKRFESVRALKRIDRHTGYTTDDHARPTIGNLLDGFVSPNAKLVVPFPRVRRPEGSRSNHHLARDRTFAQGFDLI
jgi:hypothetical protein